MTTALPPGEPTWDIADTVDREVGRSEGTDTEDEHPVAVLWLIDPEARRGLREYYVKKQAPKPNGKRMGYKR